MAERRSSAAEMGRVADWLVGTLALDREPAVAVDPALLTAYFAGTLSHTDAEGVERALLRRSDLRRQAARVAELVAGLREAGWREAARPADGLDSVVREEWRRLLGRELGEAAGARAIALEAGMDAVRDRAASGQAPARAAWRAFEAFLGRFQAVLSQPAPSYAALRGEIAPHGGHPEKSHVEHAEIAADGILHVRSAPGLDDNSEVTLWLSIGSEEWPLASSIVSEGRAEWRVRLPLNHVPLTPGPLPGEVLIVRPRAYSPPKSRAGAAPLLVTRGTRIERVIPDAVRLPAPPELRRGRLHLQLALEGTAPVQYPDGVLEVWLLAGGAGYIRLGEWKVPPAGRREIEGAVACPEPFPDDPLPLLEFRLAVH